MTLKFIIKLLSNLADFEISITSRISFSATILMTLQHIQRSVLNGLSMSTQLSGVPHLNSRLKTHK